MRRDGYDAYHGRNRFGTFLKVLIIVLIILLAAAVAALLFLEPYIVYSSDGVRLELPFFQEKEDPEPDTSAPAVVVSTPAATQTPEPEPDFRGIMLDRTALYDGTAQTQVQQAGATAAIFDMKADDGTLGYISQQTLAQETQVSASDPAINAAIQLLNSGDLYTVARVSCFRDNTVPREHGDISIPKSSGNWRDGDDYRWLSPASAEARAYVVGICQELAGLGFDEILLDNCGFPTQGKLENIRTSDNYDPDNLTGPLETFFQELDAALADYPDVTVSVVSSQSVLSGQSDSSGQTLALLEGQADRVLAVQEGEEPLPALDGVPVTPILTQAGDPGETQWAVLSAAK
ncbi:putative glycoside hydrolase [Intestinimonas massiliensis (ex Afouda et al. 2020)]|uniref:putative glycoside hydrolase n=1 Tax=Intestinimonas massiliensis (ex Afouda et al. 2020) TaxID=1673721 RepID=UPI001030E5B9|nr:putative glycoside hydrolase [Intestinimonas massiliensis (ex Afouda et al. 2020)]